MLQTLSQRVTWMASDDIGNIELMWNEFCGDLPLARSFSQDCEESSYAFSHFFGYFAYCLLINYMIASCPKFQWRLKNSPMYYPTSSSISHTVYWSIIWMYYGHCCIYILTSGEEGQPESGHIPMIHNSVNRFRTYHSNQTRCTRSSRAACSF